MDPTMNRRDWLSQCALGATAATLGAYGTTFMGASRASAAEPEPGDDSPSALATGATSRISYAVKIGMVGVGDSIREKFAALRELGYDGVELDSPTGLDSEEIVTASRNTGLPIHGVVDSVHWQDRLSHPDPAVRERGRSALAGAIRDAHRWGANSVLLVPGVVRGEDESATHVRERSISAIREVLPLSARLGIRILIENVWNGFLYDPNGGDDQTAQELREYIDEIASPWVGVYFDLGNHRKFAHVEKWIEELGSRIVKLDVKDWGREAGWSKIGDGDVDWKAVRSALHSIHYTGWATAEVSGGDTDRLAEILERMKRALEG